MPKYCHDEQVLLQGLIAGKTDQVRARALSLSVFTHTYAYTAHTGGVSVAELKLTKQKTCAHIQRTQAEYLLQQRARASVGQAPAHACTHARARARRRR